MGFYDDIDLDFSWQGDFLIGSDGDLKDTSDDYLLALVNDIRDITKSELGDWYKDPQFACSLSEFQGMKNTRETGKALENRVKSRIIALNLVKSEDLIVKVTPVHINQVMILITILATSTPENKLEIGEPIKLSFVYDSTENGIYFMPPNIYSNDDFLV